MSKMYRRHGMRIRTKACEMAARVMASRPDEALMPMGWNLAVFFESYMLNGANETANDFGPQEQEALILELVKPSTK